MGHSALVLALAFVLVVAFGGSTAAAAAAAPLRAGRQQQQQAVTVTVDGSAILATTSDRYVSFTADWHVCEVEQPAVPPARCNWHNASILRWNLSRLLPYARGLSPYRTALLRIGGGPADNAVYDVGPTPRPALRRNGTAQGSYVSSCPGPLCLTMQRWDELNAFASQAGIQIVFGLNALSARMTQGSGGKSRVISGVEWDTTNVRALLEYTKQKGFVERGSLYGFELGNEIQGPAHEPPAGRVHKGLSATFHAQQFITLSRMIDEIWGRNASSGGGGGSSSRRARPRLIGPDQNPCCTTWTQTFLDTLRRSNGSVRLDAFTYHNYDGHKVDHAPGVLAKELPTPAFLQRHIERGAEFQQIVAAESPGTELWLGEFASCAGSGVAGVSDSFESCLWYMDALGSLATQGHKVLARQALFGGDYELIDRGSFTPNPDYWLAFLWPRLMGTRVLRLANPAGNRTGLRAYAHCGLLLEGVALALVNLSPNETLEVTIDGVSKQPSDQPRQEYHLSGSVRGSGGLPSRTLYMRGAPVTEASFESPLLVAVSKPVVLLPHSVAFVDIPDAGVGLCAT